MFIQQHLSDKWYATVVQSAFCFQGNREFSLLIKCGTNSNFPCFLTMYTYPHGMAYCLLRALLAERCFTTHAKSTGSFKSGLALVAFRPVYTQSGKCLGFCLVSLHLIASAGSLIALMPDSCCTCGSLFSAQWHFWNRQTRVSNGNREIKLPEI